jgi:alkylation response protein AidB-like acyl-CoA dehydrogenase
MEKMGMHAAPTGEIFLEDVRVPRSHLLGDPDAPARDAAEETLASERAAIVAMCLGVIERCLDDSVAYAMDRMQFGKPIAAFQLIQQKLARMCVAHENVRNLMFKLIWLQENRSGTEREVSSAKWYATEAACDVALEAVQLMGGAGYMREHAPERLFRDIKLWTIGGGTSEIQQLTIAKDLLRERGFLIDLAGGHRDTRTS